MIRVERPAGGIMRKPGAFYLIMALGTLVRAVAIVADSVNLFLRFRRHGGFLPVMASGAAFLAMAVNTPETK